MKRPHSAFAAAAVLAAALGLAGCGGDGVELNGKIFDVVGLSSKSATKAKEPKMVARAPLVVPPNVERLPLPGKPPESEATSLAALNDPDKVATLDRAELERQQKEYCYKNYEIPKRAGHEEADAAEGPLGPCRGSVLNLVKGLGSDEGDGQEGQVEQ